MSFYSFCWPQFTSYEDLPENLLWMNDTYFLFTSIVKDTSMAVSHSSWGKEHRDNFHWRREGTEWYPGWGKERTMELRTYLGLLWSHCFFKIKIQAHTTPILISLPCACGSGHVCVYIYIYIMNILFMRVKTNWRRIHIFYDPTHWKNMLHEVHFRAEFNNKMVPILAFRI